MNRKLILFSVLAVALVMVFVAASAITAFALVVSDSAQVEVAPAENVFEAAPVEAEVSPAVAEPYEKVERASYHSYSDGCPFSESKMLMTERTPAEAPVEDAPLAQLSLE